MKSNRNWLAGSLLGAVAVSSAMGISIATAADEATPAAPAAPGPHAWHHHHGAGRLLAKLNLTAEQQAAVKTIMTNARPQMKSLHQEMRANSLKLRQTQPNDPNYANVVASHAGKRCAAFADDHSERGGARASVQGVDARAANAARGTAGADAGSTLSGDDPVFAEQLDHAALADQMSRADDDQVVLVVVEQRFDLGHPFAVARDQHGLI